MSDLAAQCRSSALARAARSSVRNSARRSGDLRFCLESDRVVNNFALEKTDMRKKKSVDITLAGIGIGGFEQTTLETLAAINTARVIFHLTEYQRILRGYCKRVINLEKEYWTGDQDWKVYK